MIYKPNWTQGGSIPPLASNLNPARGHSGTIAMEKSYYLFGSGAVNAYEDGGAEEVLKMNDSFGTFEFIEGYTKSEELVEAVMGWNAYIAITKGDYFKLVFAPEAGVKKIGLGTDTSICFTIENKDHIVVIIGNFYGDVFEVSGTDGSPESDQFAEDWADQIESLLINVFTEDERRA
jgi:hypothetical protein